MVERNSTAPNYAAKEEIMMHLRAAVVRLGRRMLNAGLLLLAFFALSAVAVAQPVTEIQGSLPNGTQYLMRVPSNWNGVLINDLDYRTNAGHERYAALLSMGYGLAGTARRFDRTTHYNPVNEIQDLLAVQDLFAQQFGTPWRVLQYGHSGGGHVALAMAEMVPDRIDGAVVGCAHTPVWLMNTMLDGWFVAKSLIAPDLQIVGLPAPGTPEFSALTTAWRAAIDAAQSTPEGRARIALAITLGQWPGWTTGAMPDIKDTHALQLAMYATLRAAASQPGGQSRYMFEQSARTFVASATGQLSWNTGVDYAARFNLGNEFYKQAVRDLYREASLDLSAELAIVNAAPRISADSAALDFWSVHGRTVNGKPQVPLLRIHTVGDLSVPVNLVQGYDHAIRRNAKSDLYRTGIIEATGHCTFTAAESIAAIETLMERLDTGRWSSTAQPKKLNDLGESLHSSPSRYIHFDLEAYARTWFPQ
ncbi:MAG: hypothetical protein KJ018_07140 [Burkholderiales bacterium]|nr:hypothetical protein [Burkholderiales bacterium]